MVGKPQPQIDCRSVCLQGGPSSHGIQFVDMKLKVLLQYTILILKRNSYFNVNKRLSSTRLATLYEWKPTTQTRSPGGISNPFLDFFLSRIDDERCRGLIGSCKTAELFRDAKGWIRQCLKSTSNWQADIAKPRGNNLPTPLRFVYVITPRRDCLRCSLHAYHRVVVASR